MKRHRHLVALDGGRIEGGRQERAAQDRLHPRGERRDVLTVVPIRPRPIVDPPTRPAA